MKTRSLYLNAALSAVLVSAIGIFASANGQSIKETLKNVLKTEAGKIANPNQPPKSPTKTTPQQQRQPKVAPALAKARESVAELKRLAVVTDFGNTNITKFPDELESEIFNFIVEGGAWQQLATTETEVASLAQKFWDGFIAAQYKTLQSNAQVGFCGDSNVDDIYEYVARSKNSLEHYAISRDSLFVLLQKSCKGINGATLKAMKKKAYGLENNKLAAN